MARLLVTGAASFSGHHLLPLLEAHPEVEEVWGSDRAGDAAERILPADLERAEEVAELLRASDPTHVVHLAGVSAADEDRCFAVNLEGTRRLLAACAAQARPPAVLVVSSAAVYGLTRPEESPVGESVPLRPVTPYGASKAAAELAALAAHRRGRVPVTVVRPFNLVGPGLRPGMAPSDFVAQALAIRAGSAPPEIHVGNLDPRRDFVDVRDAARAYVELVLRDDLRGRVFNVASGRAVPVRELLERALAAAGVEARVVVDAARVRPVDVPVQAGDPSALRAATGWQAEIPLARSLADMVEAAPAR